MFLISKSQKVSADTATHLPKTSKENLSMQVKDAYEILGVAPEASKEEIARAYFILASECLKTDKSNDEFLDLSRAFISLSESNKGLMLYSLLKENSETKSEPRVATSLKGKLWERKLSLASILGLALMGGVGVFAGFSFQPKTVVVREIIREAAAPTELATSNKKFAVSDIPTKAPEKLTTSKAVKKENTDAPNKPAQVLQKNIGVIPPSIGPLVYVPPVGRVQPRGTIQPLPPVPGMPTPRLMSPVAVRNQVTNTAHLPLQVSQTREDKSDKTLPVVTAPPAPTPEIDKQIEPLTPQARTLSAEHHISAADVLSTIEIPLEGGGTVKANTLLQEDQRIWKAKKGITRQKLSTLIAALVESKDLTLSAQKAGLSLQDVQSLVKPPTEEQKASDN
jgi:hypothetical protein